jgi:hypothetical protein
MDHARQHAGVAVAHEDDDIAVAVPVAVHLEAVDDAALGGARFDLPAGPAHWVECERRRQRIPGR